jgi:hypothetical protein
MPIGQAKFGILGGVADPGKLELIETQTHSSDVSDIDFTSIDESTYNVHLLTFSSTKGAGTNPQMKVRFFESGVKETASVYQNAIQFCDADGVSFNEARSTADSGIPIQGNYMGGVTQGYVYLYNLGDSSKYSFLTLQSSQYSGTYGSRFFGFGSGVMTQSSTVNGINLYNSNAGNFTDFDISLYGIKEYS